MERKYTELVVGDTLKYCGAELQVAKRTVTDGVATLVCSIVKKAGLNMRWGNTKENTYTIAGTRLMRVDMV